MNSLETYYRVKRELAEKQFEEKLAKEKAEFELMIDDEKKEYLKKKKHEKDKLDALLSIPYLGINEVYK